MTISTDKSKLDVPLIHAFLTETYWAKDRTIETVEKSIEHSLCFGVYKDGKQIGFGRVATDYTIFAYIMDVFVLPEQRGKGYSKQLMQAIVNASALKSCETWLLKTVDAHGLYNQFGFAVLKYPEKVLEKVVNN